MDQAAPPAPRRNWLAQSALIVFLVLALGTGLILVTIAYFSEVAVDIVRESDGDPVVIVGIGNSGNHFNEEASGGKLSRTLAALDSTPAITNDMLGQLYDATWTAALQGDTDAAAIIARIAEIQRTPPEPASSP